MKKGYAGFATIGKADFSLSKRNAEEKVSPSAEGEEASAAFTAQAFEKIKRASTLTKTFSNRMKPVCFVYSLGAASLAQPLRKKADGRLF